MQHHGILTWERTNRRIRRQDQMTVTRTREAGLLPIEMAPRIKVPEHIKLCVEAEQRAPGRTP